MKLVSEVEEIAGDFYLLVQSKDNFKRTLVNKQLVRLCFDVHQRTRPPASDGRRPVNTNMLQLFSFTDSPYITMYGECEPPRYAAGE